MTYESPDLNIVVPEQYLPQYIPPNPLLPQAPKDIERRKIQAQDPKLIAKFELTIELKNKDIKEWSWELRGNPQNLALRDKIILRQGKVRLLMDNIQRINDDTYHLR